jgi:tRNA A37 threonylcarbamoyladenosine synthetase subunit TsaC/SUA5/YrdC
VAPPALRAALGAPLVSSTLLLPGQDEPMIQGWEINQELGDAVDAVLDSGDCGTEPTTVIDFSGPEPEIVRRGAGDTSDFE